MFSSLVSPTPILKHVISSDTPIICRDQWEKCWSVSSLGDLPTKPQWDPFMEWGLAINDKSRTKQLCLTLLVLSATQWLSHFVYALLIFHCANLNSGFQSCAFRNTHVLALLWHWFISAYSHFSSPPLFPYRCYNFHPKSIRSCPSLLQWHTCWWGWISVLIPLCNVQALSFMPKLRLVHTTGKGKEAFVQMHIRSSCILLQVILQSSESETWELQTCVTGECC